MSDATIADHKERVLLAATFKNTGGLKLELRVKRTSTPPLRFILVDGDTDIPISDETARTILMMRDAI